MASIATCYSGVVGTTFHGTFNQRTHDTAGGVAAGYSTADYHGIDPSVFHTPEQTLPLGSGVGHCEVGDGVSVAPERSTERVSVTAAYRHERTRHRDVCR